MQNGLLRSSINQKGIFANDFAGVYSFLCHHKGFAAATLN